MTTIGPYCILRIIGKGGFSVVLLAKHEETGDFCALKIMDKNIDNEESIYNLVCNEVEIMSSISHKNIIGLINYSFNDSIIKPNGDSKEVYYRKLASNGELFDFLAETGAFSEEIARYYFHQLVDALEYLNAHGISHRDIKPENMMFDKDYNLKLADFGFSSSQPLNQSKKGTVSYMAPEVYEGLVYNGHCADLFSAGVILFLMISRHPPFFKACSSDPHYKLIMGNRQDIFWKVHSKGKADNFYSKSLRQFVSWLLSFNPMERPSLAEIKEQEWYNGLMPTTEEIKEEFSMRKAVLNNENYQPDSKIPTGKPDPTIIGTGNFRSGDGNEKTDREIAPYIPEFKRYTQFFSTSDPEILFATLALYAEKKCKETRFERDFYSASMKTTGEIEVEIRVNILKAEDSKYCVEVIKESGDRFEFDQIYRSIRDFYGGLVNAKA